MHNKEAKGVQMHKPEVAWVVKSGEKAFHTPIALRPTSESIMYPCFSNITRSTGIFFKD